MNVEIHNPELFQRMNARVQAGHFRDADELIEKALDALDGKPHRNPATGKTGAVILEPLQACPYPDVDLTSPKTRITKERDVVRD